MTNQIIILVFMVMIFIMISIAMDSENALLMALSFCLLIALILCSILIVPPYEQVDEEYRAEQEQNALIKEAVENNYPIYWNGQQVSMDTVEINENKDAD